MFTLESSDFKDGAAISKINTCEGANTSPELHWLNPPDNTQSFALICDDPDAPTAEPWVHWIVYNIPSSQKKLIEGFDRTVKLGDGTMQGLNTFDRIGFDGPCPPNNENHRYFFKLYALDTVLNVEPGLTKNQLLSEIEGHIIDQAELIGTYKLEHKNL